MDPIFGVAQADGYHDPVVIRSLSAIATHLKSECLEKPRLVPRMAGKVARDSIGGAKHEAGHL